MDLSQPQKNLSTGDGLRKRENIQTITQETIYANFSFKHF